MKILIIGQPENFEEFKLKFGDGHEYSIYESLEQVDSEIAVHDVLFDFIIEDAPEMVQAYNSVGIPVFLNTVKISLSELNYIYGLSDNVFGFNGLKTFVNRTQLEVTALKSTSLLKDTLSKLNTEFLVIDDRVGMVTPRVIMMIINEAFYTVQEGTAKKEDIDLGMRLGTNYPYGPFEWAEKIGVKDIYETLEAIYEDTKDERYKICPLLKKEYLAV